MSEHSRFGGSVAERYLNCEGSVRLLETLPPGRESSYALDGSKAHRLGELCLKTGERNAHTYAGETLWVHGSIAFTVTPEMADAVQVYLDAVYEAVDADPNHELFVEQKFTFDLPNADDDEVFGSNDAMVYLPSLKKLFVFDYKNGQGVSITAEENKQLEFYAAGAVLSVGDQWPLAEIELVIVQPRAYDAEEAGAVRRWLFDPVDLLDFAGTLNEVVGRAKRFKLGEGLVAGPWCKKSFCPALGTTACTAHEKAVLDQMRLDYPSVADIMPGTLPQPAALTAEHREAIRKGARLLAEWVQALENYDFNTLLSGGSVPGWKLVEKTARRKWDVDDETAVVGYMELMYDLKEDDVRPRKLATITEIERLLKAQGFDKAARDEAMFHFTKKESSGLTMAPLTDKRPAVDAVAQDFSGVDLMDGKED